jgi:DMSO/TMAO reductase YedYZ molybdopterin-dependent catalytic subunit
VRLKDVLAKAGLRKDAVEIAGNGLQQPPRPRASISALGYQNGLFKAPAAKRGARFTIVRAGRKGHPSG